MPCSRETVAGLCAEAERRGAEGAAKIEETAKADIAAFAAVAGSKMDQAVSIIVGRIVND